jgi:uncharacterized protein YxeA
MAKILVILVLVVVLAVWVTRLQGNAYARFKANSAEVMGRIDKKETRFDNTKNRHSENYLLYSYTVDGKNYSGEERVEYDDMWLDAREGMELRVYYAKNNPAKSYPAALIDRRLGVADKLR